MKLEEAVIQRTEKSAGKMLRELFTSVELGDQTPSQLMRHMRSLLAGRQMDDAIFREIWVAKLPLPMQLVLSMLEPTTPLDKLAQHANRIIKCYPAGGPCVHMTSPAETTPTHESPTALPVPAPVRRADVSLSPDSPSHHSHIDEDITDLTETVRMLCNQVSAMCNAFTTHRSVSTEVPHRPRSRSRNRRLQTWCWYHRTFGSKARRFKRPGQLVTAMTSAGPPHESRLFYIVDRSSGVRFLIDTGAEISVIPPPKQHSLKPSHFTLQAANTTTIATFGQRTITPDSGLRRSFQWVFIQADVQTPIIGADFLPHFGLTVDLKNRKLVDTTTKLCAAGIGKCTNSLGIRLAIPQSPFADILNEFPSLPKPSTSVHQIESDLPRSV
nr:unnamed protein product [Fasciola hepatica]